MFKSLLPVARRHVRLFPFQGGAPVKTARNTAAGSLAFADMVVNQWGLPGFKASTHPVLDAMQESGRDDTLSPSGIRNEEQVKRALYAHLEDTAAGVLQGEKRHVSVGGDHSMAWPTIKGLALGHAARDILQANSGNEPENPGLMIHSPQSSSALQGLRAACDAVAIADVGTYIDALIDHQEISTSGFKNYKSRYGVLWPDAHFDANTPYDATGVLTPGARFIEHESDSRFVDICSPSPSGNFHGMPLAAVLGSGAASFTHAYAKHLALSGNAAFVGVRDGDELEHTVINDILGMSDYSMDDIRRDGLSATVSQAMDRLKASAMPYGKPKIIGTIDIDLVDARYVPLTGTPVGRGSARNTAPGPSLVDTMQAFEGFLSDDNVIGINIAELAHNKTKDPDNLTVFSGVALYAALIGEVPRFTEHFRPEGDKQKDLLHEIKHAFCAKEDSRREQACSTHVRSA